MCGSTCVYAKLYFFAYKQPTSQGGTKIKYVDGNGNEL